MHLGVMANLVCEGSDTHQVRVCTPTHSLFILNVCYCYGCFIGRELRSHMSWKIIHLKATLSNAANTAT